MPSEIQTGNFRPFDTRQSWDFPGFDVKCKLVVSPHNSTEAFFALTSFSEALDQLACRVLTEQYTAINH